MTLIHFQILSAAMFSIGLYGVLARRNALLVLLSIEIMLNADSLKESSNDKLDLMISHNIIENIKKIIRLRNNLI